MGHFKFEELLPSAQAWAIVATEEAFHCGQQRAIILLVTRKEWRFDCAGRSV